jgi:CubicO group peptidase (beta-lactamase class C family)
VVEEVTRKSFADFMHDDVLKPLGMTASRVAYDEGTGYARRVARGHDKNGKRGPDNPVTPEKRAALSHSDRRAITGSILVARRAGNHDAHSVTSSKKTDSAR